MYHHGRNLIPENFIRGQSQHGFDSTGAAAIMINHANEPEQPAIVI
jgi:hypothetical protein